MPLHLAVTSQPSTSPRSQRSAIAEPRPRRRERRRERARLAEHDRIAAHLAELHRIRTMLREAATLVDAGWVRDAWFGVRVRDGALTAVTAHEARLLDDHPVSAACLVGAIVQAGGGLAAVQSQPVQRALDLTWHTLARPEGEPVRWCPAPPVRASHVRDLTGWNDEPGRTAPEVAGLLRAAERTAGAEIAGVHT